MPRRSLRSAGDLAEPGSRRWLSEKRKSAEFKQPPASRQHFDLSQFGQADGEWLREKAQIHGDGAGGYS
jgi:hypothetical protein